MFLQLAHVTNIIIEYKLTIVLSKYLTRNLQGEKIFQVDVVLLLITRARHPGIVNTK